MLFRLTDVAEEAGEYAKKEKIAFWYKSAEIHLFDVMSCL